MSLQEGPGRFLLGSTCLSPMLGIWSGTTRFHKHAEFSSESSAKTIAQATVNAP